MTRGAVSTASAETDTALLGWALPPALGSSQSPGTHQRLSVSCPKRLSVSSPKSHLTSSLRAGRGAQTSSSCSPSPDSCLIHSSISLLFWKPSTPVTQRKAGFKQSPSPGTLCYLESTSVLEFPFFPVPAALEEVPAAPSLPWQCPRDVPLPLLPPELPWGPRVVQWGRMGGGKYPHTNPAGPQDCLENPGYPPIVERPSQAGDRPFHTPRFL